MIYSLCNLNMGSVMPFIDIFIKILDSFNGDTGFQVNVSIIFFAQIRIIWHNPSIIKIKIPYPNSTAIVRSMIRGIPIHIHNRFIIKRLWITFWANTINHTRATIIQSTTWPMNHVGLDDLIKLRFSFWIRKLCTNQAVNIIRIPQLEFGCKMN